MTRCLSVATLLPYFLHSIDYRYQLWLPYQLHSFMTAFCQDFAKYFHKTKLLVACDVTFRSLVLVWLQFCILVLAPVLWHFKCLLIRVLSSWYCRQSEEQRLRLPNWHRIIKQVISIRSVDDRGRRHERGYLAMYCGLLWPRHGHRQTCKPCLMMFDNAVQ